MGINRPHSNHDLFSNHYLDEIIQTEKDWQDIQGLEEIFMEIKRLYKEKSNVLPSLNEPQLESEFIQPILKILGHHFIVQPQTKTSEGIRRPDYALFDSETTKNDALPLKGKEWELFKKAVGICEAKNWNRKLDLSTQYEPDLFDFENRNPAYQMQQYLYYSEIRWGILTNGRTWRLYEREQSKKLDRYYEIDLLSLIDPFGPLFASGSSEAERFVAFKYFYLFFRAQAFPDFLDNVLEGSVKYAKAVGDELKDNVYKALRILAQGFVESKENRLDPKRDKELIRENCFVLLYRMLFILFAEARLLLPVSNRNYQELSLENIKNEIHSKRTAGIQYASGVSILWSKLSGLFRLINDGDDDLKIPPYNGGLFDSEQHTFLRDNRIGDRFLVEVIDLLSRPKKETSKKEFIDYSSLEVRHLGSIYEGLLENRLEIAEEPMVAVKAGRKEIWKKGQEVKGASKVVDRVEKGQFYPVTERGERKATGSYYTPDYIVKYIVEQTLEPLTKGKKEKELLALRILDPAMGSGHFLVEATDFLARKLLGSKKIEETDDEIGKAKRLVIERSIFGVDKNLLAVELAKLSLWLSTVASNKPLSFLDHHLRCGDSLIGAKVDELGNLPEEKPQPLFKSILSHYSASTIGFYRQIESEPSDNINQIHDKLTLLNQARNQMEPFRKAADLWVSTFFGNELIPADFSNVLEVLRQGGGEPLKQFEKEAWFKKMQNLWEEHRFFHWELEFPDVFFDKHGRFLSNPGFDAVIGNPPWGSSLVRESSYLSVFFVNRSGEAESHLFFIEKGFKLINNTGLLGFITPNTWLAIINSKEIRQYLLKESTFSEIKELSKYIFDDAPDIVPIIIILGKKKVKVSCMTSWPKVTKVTEENFGSVFVTNEIDQQEWVENSDYSIVIRSTSQTREINQKCILKSTQLAVICDVLYGIKTGDNKRYLSSVKTKNHQVRALKTGELSRYKIDWKGIYLWWCQELEGYKDFSIEVPKIVIQYIRKLSLSRRIVAALDTAGDFYPLNNYSYILLKDMQYSLNYILGIINSELMNYYFANTFVDYNIKPTYLQLLPIRTINFSKPSDKVIHDEIVEHVKKMLDLQKSKQTICGEYEGWLEHLIHAKLDRLSGKEAIRNLDELDKVNKLSDLLSKNRKLDFNTREPTNYGLLSKGVDKYKSKLNPVFSDIAETDRKIDFLVYRLYGLTEEEIKIVEGQV